MGIFCAEPGSEEILAEKFEKTLDNSPDIVYYTTCRPNDVLM
jgi:hypothetical protein